VDTTQKLPTVLSLCTGYGGVERGLDLAGVEHRVIAHVEIEAFAIANLVTKMEANKMDAAPVWSNLKTLPVEPFRDRVDILTGGYPCQPFSSAGNRLGEEDPRHLWPYICDIIRAVRPVRCFFENVEGHISLGLREVISDLESLGYKTAWGIFSAREVGAPHQRKRVYIMGYASGQRCEQDSTLRDKQPAGRIKSERGQSGSRLANTESQFSEWSISERDTTGQSEEALGDRSDSERASSVGNSYGKRLEGRNSWSREGMVSKPKRSDSREGSLAYADSSWELQSKRNEQNEWGRVSDCSEDVADTNSSGLGQGDKEDARQSSEQSDGNSFRSGNVTNSNNERLEGRLQGKCIDAQGRQEQEIRCASERSNWGSGSGHSLWPLEPRLGRVVDGCADRVDRIRLLGNGVVPQTAAKAWMVLSKELESKNGKMQHE